MADQAEPPPDLQQPPAASRQRKQAAGVAALALAAGQTVKAAAKKAGIGESTLYGWMKKPAFTRRVDELRARMVSEAVGKMSRSMAGAATALDRLVKSKDERTRLAAAKAVLELATTLRQSEELQRQVSELRERMDAMRGTT